MGQEARCSDLTRLRAELLEIRWGELLSPDGAQWRVAQNNRVMDDSTRELIRERLSALIPLG